MLAAPLRSSPRVLYRLLLSWHQDWARADGGFLDFPYFFTAYLEAARDHLRVGKREAMAAALVEEASYGHRPCPNTFCPWPILRHAPVGPWRSECFFCERTTERVRKAAERAEAKAPTQWPLPALWPSWNWGPVPPGMLAGEGGVVHCWMRAKDTAKGLDEDSLDDSFVELMESNGENHGAKRSIAGGFPDDQFRDGVDEADVPDDLPNLGLSGELAVAWQHGKDWAVDELMDDMSGTISANLAVLRGLENFAHFENAIYTHWLTVLYPHMGADRKPWSALPRREEGKPFKSRDPDVGKRWPPSVCWLRGNKNRELKTWVGAWSYGDYRVQAHEYPTRIAGLLRARREAEYLIRVLIAEAENYREHEPLDAYEREAVNFEVQLHPHEEPAEAAKRIITEDDDDLAHDLAQEVLNQAPPNPIDAESGL
jgi:hypothetical protein